MSPQLLQIAQHRAIALGVRPVDVEVSKLKFNRERDLVFGEAQPFAQASGWEIVEFEYPILAIILTRPASKRRIGFRFQCDQWDEQPPSLSLFEPEPPYLELPWGKWPKNGWNAAPSHKRYAKPFLCLPGIREYHIHESHLNDRWEGLRHRQTYTLVYIVHRVQEKFGVTHD